MARRASDAGNGTGAPRRPRTPAVYRAAFDHAPDALFLLDDEGRVVELNRAAARLPLVSSPTGGVPFLFLWPRAVRPTVARWVERLVREKDAPRLEVALPGPAGDIVLELSGCDLRGEAYAPPPPLPDLREVLVRDITERVRLAERALHSERLASVGRLAATLAHEIRNTLAGVDGALQVFQAADDLLPARREIVAEMRDRIGRTREVVDDLLAYSRPPRLTRLPWPVADVLEAIRDSVAGHPEAESIEIVATDRCLAEQRVAVDVFQVRLVARNLILNGAQAMGGRGTIHVTAEPQGGDVVFRFVDEGPGVEEEYRDRVFEPFFTTRPAGTGLGLPIAANIVQAHGGRLFLEPGPGPANRFVIALPLHGASADDDAQNRP